VGFCFTVLAQVVKTETMKNINEEIYCSKCKTTVGDFIVAAKGNNKDYYYCLPCKAERGRKYSKGIGRVKAYKIVRDYALKNKEKVSAWAKVKRALKMGVMVKPSICSNCGSEKKSRFLQGHHRDYSKPLDVLWLCARCHISKHKSFHTLKD